MTKQNLVLLYVVARNEYDSSVIRAANQPDTDVSLAITEAWIEFLDKLYTASEQYLAPKFPKQWATLAELYSNDHEDFVCMIELFLFA